MSRPPRALRCQFVLMLALVFGAASGSVRADDPLGLPELKFPDDNSPTAEKIALGKQLFFDTRLSSDGRVSCATCHDPKRGFGGADPFSDGVNAVKVGRHTPILINVALQKTQFWDGRAKTLEKQVLWPLQAPGARRVLRCGRHSGRRRVNRGRLRVNRVRLIRRRIIRLIAGRVRHACRAGVAGIAAVPSASGREEQQRSGHWQTQFGQFGGVRQS